MAHHPHVTTTVAPTYTILDHEFEFNQLENIVKHGMFVGVSGFIYNSELHDIYERHEDEIQEALDVLASDLGIQSGVQMVINAITKGDTECFYSLQSIKARSVWMFVEMKAMDILRDSGHPDWA